jgi:hypothetical protein
VPPVAPVAPAETPDDVPEIVKTAKQVSDIINHIVDKEGLTDEDAVVARMAYFAEKVTRMSRIPDLIGRSRKIFAAKMSAKA